MRKMLEVVKEYDQELYEEVRFEYIHNNIELDEEEVELFLEALSYHSDIEDALTMMENLKEIYNNEYNSDVFEVFKDNYNLEEAIEHFEGGEFRVYDDFEEIGNDWIDNVVGYERLEDAISEVAGSYLASKIMYQIDCKELGEDLYKDSSNMFKTPEGRIVEFYW